ncbi:MAG: hypothetical protein ACXAD7_15190 [Candidatus Kariarchaeaceae archaeon]
MTEIIDSVFPIDSKNSNYYELLMFFSELTPRKQRILLVLAHLSFTAISAYQLSSILGYSPKSRGIYKGILNELRDAGLIHVYKGSKNQHLITISREHPQIAVLVDLVRTEGKSYQSKIYDVLDLRCN